MATIFSTFPIDSQSARTNRQHIENFVDRFTAPIPSRSAGPIVAFFQTIISLGLLPLLLWPIRWVEFIDGERDVLQDHIQWWARRADEKNAKKLDKIAARLKRRPILMLIPWLAVGLNGLVMTMMISQGTTLDKIWDLTFDHVHRIQPVFIEDRSEWESPNSGFIQLGTGNRFSHPHVIQSAQLIQTSPGPDLYKIWLISLCVGYGVHWYSVRSHATTVQSLVDWTNKLARENNFARINPRAGCIGLNFLWIILGIGLCSVHAWWAIPMVFAGAMQRQYTRTSSTSVRAALASQTREVFAFTRSGPDRMCRSANCGAILPAAANYCPRCGTHA